MYDSDTDSDSDDDSIESQYVRKARRALLGDEQKHVGRRRTVAHLLCKADVSIFLPEDGYVADALTVDHVLRMADPEDARFDERRLAIRCVFDDVVGEGIAKGRFGWSAFFADNTKTVDHFPTVVGLAVSRLLCRVPRDFGHKNLTPDEIVMNRETIARAVEDVVSKRGRCMPAFLVHLTTCGADGRAALAFPRDGVPSRWTPEGNARDERCLGSLRGSVDVLRWKGAGEGARAPARHARAYTRMRGLNSDTLSFLRNATNSFSRSLASPFLPLHFRLTVGGSSRSLAPPAERRVPLTTRGNWTREMLVRYNALGKHLAKERRVPPPDGVVTILRLLPVALHGAPASDVLPLSCADELPADGSARIALPPEGSGSSLRDRALATAMLYELVHADIKIVQAHEHEDQPRDPDVVDELLLPTFDSLGLLAQIVVVFVVALVMGEAWVRVLRRDPDFAARAGALHIVAYAACARAWARRIIEHPAGCSNSPDRQDPTRRRVLLMTLFGVIRCGGRNLRRWGLDPSTPPAIRLAQAAVRSFAELAELATCVSAGSFRRMVACDVRLGDELLRDAAADDAPPRLPDDDARPRSLDTDAHRRLPDGAPCTVWYAHVRASAPRQLGRVHSARSQFAVSFWTMRRHAERARRAGRRLARPDEIALSIAVGSKIHPRRIDTILVTLSPHGVLFQALVDFVMTFDDDADPAADADADAARALADPAAGADADADADALADPAADADADADADALADPAAAADADDAGPPPSPPSPPPSSPPTDPSPSRPGSRNGSSRTTRAAPSRTRSSPPFSPSPPTR